MSFSVWYWADSTDTDGGKIMGKPWDGSTGKYNYFLERRSDNKISLFIAGSSSQTFISKDVLKTDEWNNITITLSSTGSVKIYLNGILDTDTLHTITNWTPASDVNQSLVLGCIFPYGAGWAGNTTYCVKGKIDNFRIYNDVLSGDEVNRLYAIENRKIDEPAAFFPRQFF